MNPRVAINTLTTGWDNGGPLPFSEVGGGGLGLALVAREAEDLSERVGDEKTFLWVNTNLSERTAALDHVDTFCSFKNITTFSVKKPLKSSKRTSWRSDSKAFLTPLAAHHLSKRLPFSRKTQQRFVPQTFYGS